MCVVVSILCREVLLFLLCQDLWHVQNVMVVHEPHHKMFGSMAVLGTFYTEKVFRGEDSNSATFCWWRYFHSTLLVSGIYDSPTYLQKLLCWDPLALSVFVCDVCYVCQLWGVAASKGGGGDDIATGRVSLGDLAGNWTAWPTLSMQYASPCVLAFQAWQVVLKAKIGNYPPRKPQILLQQMSQAKWCIYTKWMCMEAKDCSPIHL